MSTELAGPVSAPTQPFPAGSPPSSGGLGVSGPVGPPQMGVSTLGYPSGLAGPAEIGARSVQQVSPSSIATVAAVEQPSPPQSSSLAAGSSYTVKKFRKYRDKLFRNFDGTSSVQEYSVRLRKS